jgi:REP element-mobilizing transposase RayT
MNMKIDNPVRAKNISIQPSPQHHRRSIRLRGYDYSREGLYFITICTQNRECLFGEIGNGEMMLNEYGEIVKTEWLKSVEIRAEIEIHAYCIMPNHFHAIAEIVAVGGTDVGANAIRPNDNGIRPNIEICPNINGGVCHTPLRSPSRTVGALVRGFKSSVTKQIGFSIWQRNYYEHIIRNEKSYFTISEYIINNPAKWETDKLYRR